MAKKYQPITLPDPVRTVCNQCLSDLQGLMADIDKADKAGINGMESIKTRCQECMDKFAGIKSVYFPNKS